MTAFHLPGRDKSGRSLNTGFSNGTYVGPEETGTHCAACEDGDCALHFSDPPQGDSDYFGSNGRSLFSRFVRELDGQLIWRANPSEFHGNGKDGA